jgi:cytidylate kinase
MRRRDYQVIVNDQVIVTIISYHLAEKDAFDYAVYLRAEADVRIERRDDDGPWQFHSLFYHTPLFYKEVA